MMAESCMWREWNKEYIKWVTAVMDAWNSDGNPGIVYTTDWEGKICS